MFTERPELFSNNADPAGVFPIDNYYIAALRRIGSKITQPYYLTNDTVHPDRDVFAPRHIIAEMCRAAGLNGSIRIRPYLHLDEAERTFGAFAPHQIAIQSSGLSAAIPYRNKEWGAERFAAVARMLAGVFTLVQLGASTDPALPVDHDLRGKTTLREAAAVLGNSTAFVGLEGFLTHLARAVDCPSVVIFGGRSSPAVFGYSANRNIATSPACSPCGLRNTCVFDRVCLEQITPELVYREIVAAAAAPRDPLPVDVVEI